MVQPGVDASKLVCRCLRSSQVVNHTLQKVALNLPVLGQIYQVPGSSIEVVESMNISLQSMCKQHFDGVWLKCPTFL